MNMNELRQAVAELKNQITLIEEIIGQQNEPSVEANVRGPYYDLTPGSVGFHVLKEQWRQRTYIDAHCKILLQDQNLEDTIKATRNSAPIRNIDQGFFIVDETRTPIADINPQTERGMEAAIFQRYDISTDRPQCNLWRGMFARQVPLFDSIARNGWGHIDLLAVGLKGQPIVVELKLDKGRNSEAPQRPLFEAVAYAIALKEVWANFWPSWESMLDEVAVDGIEIEELAQTKKVDVVLLAPNSYWTYWLGQQHYINGQTSYRNLIDELGKKGVDVKIVGFGTEPGQNLVVQERPDFLLAN